MEGRENRPGRLRRSLRFNLVLVLSLTVTLFAAVTSLHSYRTNMRQVQFFIDEELSGIAGVISALRMGIPKSPEEWRSPGAAHRRRGRPQGFSRLPQLLPEAPIEDLLGADREIIIAPVFSRPGTVFYFPYDLTDGLYTMMIRDRRMRVLIATGHEGVRFAVARSLEHADEAVAAAAWFSVLRFLILSGILIPSVILGVSLTFRGVRRLAKEVESRQDDDLRALQVAGPSELDVFIRALNHLFARIDAGLRRERRFIADAAHELRTPLTALSLETEALAAAGADRAPLSERIASVSRAAARMRTLTEDLLTLARSQSQGAVISRFAIRDLLVEVIEETGALADASEVDLGLAGNPQGSVCADREALRTALLNLVTNAVKYTPAGGTCDLSAAREGQTVRVTVADSGPGIPAADIGRVTEPFYRVGGDRAKTSGTGLGLAIVQSCAQRLGGTLRLENARGGGLRATLEFPEAGAQVPLPAGQAM